MKARRLELRSPETRAVPHADLVCGSIENFSVDERAYGAVPVGPDVRGNGSVLVRGESVDAEVRIDFGDTEGCKVFLGRNLQGNFSVFFRGNDSILYIGDDCKLSSVQIRSFQESDFIAVGNQVTTTSTNVWISGHGTGRTNPAIIIGDDCMFARDVIIRNSDAHPVFSLSSDEQVNEPRGIVHVEPHVWIGERVSILKSVTVGACSILALGSIVTRDVPRFSVASGVPATAKEKPDLYWARNINDRAKRRARHFVEKYKAR